MKNSKEAFIGDTICHTHSKTEPLPGLCPAKPMVRKRGGVWDMLLGKIFIEYLLFFKKIEYLF